MTRLLEVLALVPARGGSKGLPGKNVRPLDGHPLIAWSIAAGRAAASVSRVVCTSDDDEIAAAARAYGAEVPFKRPVELADDAATDLVVFAHALQWLAREQGYMPDLVVQLRPTTPFRKAEWIEEAVATMAADPDVSCVRTVAPAEKTPYKMWRRDEEGTLSPLLTLKGVAEPFNMPRQALPEVFWHTGQLDVIRPEVILSGSMTGPKIAGLQVPGSSAIDIDSIDDFDWAEFVFNARMPLALRQTIEAIKQAQ